MLFKFDKNEGEMGVMSNYVNTNKDHVTEEGNNAVK